MEDRRAFDKDQVEDAVDMMRLTASPEEYTKYLKYRLESSWGHIKEILRAYMALDECVDTLMFLQTVAEMEYSKKIMDVGQMRYDGADAELKKLAREVSPYAYRLIEQQYWSSKDRKTHYEVEELHPSLFVLTGDDPTSSYHVDTSKFEEAIMVGVASFVGRKETWNDPLSQLCSLAFTSDNTDAAGADAADVVTRVSPTSKVNCEHPDESSDEHPDETSDEHPRRSAQQSRWNPKYLKSQSLWCWILRVYLKAQKLETRTECVPNKENLVKENFVKENLVKESQAPRSTNISAVLRSHLDLLSVRNIVKLLDNDYSYEEAHRLLPTLTIRDAPKTKKAIAGIYTAEECTTDVRFIFPRQFVQMAKTTILEFRKALVVVCADDSVGVRVSRFGIFMLKDINALNRVTTAASAEGTAASVVATMSVTEKTASVEDCTGWFVVAAILAFTSLNDVKGISSHLA
ncbi:hypothetical protein JG688_00014258 [Phytophthora aleatoria]|uniref:Uncharacterized protein n=1 Tax=Phytophthora aleatoria TaxID=2496075 RepID=A0A8J5M3E5_9STRA|nr:hypothetical protein JG688_00014258 [Phytophthora aleatoria]